MSYLIRILLPYCLLATAIRLAMVNASNNRSISNATTPSRLSEFVLNAAWTRFQMDSEQPALVQAAANLIINFRDRGNAASCISAEAVNAHHRDHMDVLNSFARRLNPVIAMSIVDVERCGSETYSSQMIIFVVDGVDAFK